MKARTKVSILDGSNCAVFFDFDNTISSFDVLDDFIERFAPDREWQKYEKLWQEGMIGSRECLMRQLSLIRISNDELNKYISSITIDEAFKPLLAYFKSKGIQPMIVSDSFVLFISTILKNHGVGDIKICANHMEYDGNKFKLSFPYVNHKCNRCAHCKQSSVVKNSASKKTIVYIGDGLSDICPAEQCDIVFAKDSLLKHFNQNKLDHIGFSTLREVYNFFMEVDNGK